MKRILFILVVSVALVSGYTYQLVSKAQEHADFQVWKRCIEQSNGSDHECEQCDRMFNQDGIFDLSE